MPHQRARSIAASAVNGLLRQLRARIAQAPQQALRAVDQVQVRTSWEVGRHRLPGTGTLLESKLEDALTGSLQAFLLELGKGFAFVARQQRISTDSKDFYVGLVFYNYLLNCFVLFARKTRELTHENIGQMDMYVRLYGSQRRGPGDNLAVGIVLCANKDETVVRYSVLHDNEKLFASKYKLILPSELEFREELKREMEGVRQQQLLQATAMPRKRRSSRKIVT